MSNSSEQLENMCKGTTVMDDLPVVCNRETGHSGPHVGFHDGEGVQWSTDEAPDKLSSNDDEPMSMWSPWPEPGTPVVIDYHDGTRSKDGTMLDGIMLDVSGMPLAVIAHTDARRVVARWGAVDAISWERAE